MSDEANVEDGEETGTATGEDTDSAGGGDGADAGSASAMANETIDANNFGVTAEQIEGPTGTKVSSFDVNHNTPSTGIALARTEPFTVQIGITNKRGDENTCTIVVSDAHNNQSFRGAATIEWQANDTSTVCIQFSDFSPQADGSAMDRCAYSISVYRTQSPNTGTEVSAEVFVV